MSKQQFWKEFYELGKKAGAKFPALVAAQAALESGWGEHESGKNNFFGIKGSPGTIVKTQEWNGSRFVTIEAEFKDFDTKLDAVKHLVERWYKDWRGYEGVNRARSREEAAELLKEEGYATDPVYPELLINLMDDYAEQDYFLERAADYFVAEPHQIAAWRALEDLLDEDTLEGFKTAYRGLQEPQEVDTSPIVDKFPLKVPYFTQIDSSKPWQAERMCFSSAMAMALDYLDPNALEGDDDWYLDRVLKFGDTVSSVAQVAAAKSLGFNVKFRMDGTQEDLEELLDDGYPVPIGILHKGSVDRPTGGGHWIVLTGHDDTHFWVNDPMGDLDLVNGGYPYAGQGKGEQLRYSKKNLLKRWNIANDHDGWFMDLS